MSQQPANNAPRPLKIAWQRYAELDSNAVAASRLHLNLRWWVLALGVLATLLAVLSDIYGEAGLIGRVLGIALILVPIIASAVIAFANKTQQGERWLTLRSAAEEIKKEIYLYRTLLQKEPARDHWLNDRLAEIQRRVFETIGGEANLREYTSPIPPHYTPNQRDSDPGFSDLLPDEYLRYRLRDQLKWHARSAATLKRVRTRLQIAIFIFGGLSTLLAGVANIPGLGGLAVWVALTTALSSAFSAWLELRRIEPTINNYGQVVLELNLIQDHWFGLPPEQRNGDEFFKLVLATERVLWSQHSQFIAEMRKAVAELKGESTDTLDKVASMPAPLAIDEAVLQQVQQASGSADQADKAELATIEQKLRPGLPHALVLMPAGRRRREDGRWLDFDSIYQQVVRPALIEAGFEPIRVNTAPANGNRVIDAFQELLLADLVAADLSLSDANTFYELGVRHAVRRRGVLHLHAHGLTPSFNVFQLAAAVYHCNENGKPDPQHRRQDRQAITALARDLWQSGHSQAHSPIYNLLDGLTEPDRQSLSTSLAAGYWRAYRAWQERVEIAQQQRRVGDILLLTEEIDNPIIREQAIGRAAKILSSLGYHELALQQYQRGLELNPDNRDFRREEAFELGRLERFDEALPRLERLVEEDPADAEATAFIGRLYKVMWRKEWHNQSDPQARQKTAYDNAHLLKRSIDAYLSGYSAQQNHYYSGINAVTLASLLLYLAQTTRPNAQTDPQTAAVKQQLSSLIGAVKFSLQHAARREPNNYWVLASLAELAVCTAKKPETVGNLYRQALSLSAPTESAVRSTLEQLEMLDALGFRPEHVAAGVAALKPAMKMNREKDTPSPEQVFLFSGHMIDHPDRPTPRFPPEMEAEARQKIETALTQLNAGPEDLAITAGAACGGDILFIEACLRRNMRVEVYLPFPEAEFIAQSVSFAGESWTARFNAIRQHPNVTLYIQPERVGPVPPGDNAFARNNRWALYNALAYGFERVRLIVLWNGQGGDGPGGTRHMVEEVRRLGGVVTHLDTSRFDYWQTAGRPTSSDA